MTFRYLQAAILDWAGTAVDFGSLAPVAALQGVFADNSVPITAAEARQHMGILKKDQIRAICGEARVRGEWRRQHGSEPVEQDIERMFAEFLPRQTEILARFSTPIPGAVDAVEQWRGRGLKIGSSTGYTRALLDVVIEASAALGYKPDVTVTPDEVGGGRPKPFMCYRNAILLGVYPLWQCVKIGDTPADINEGLNAGMWTIGITTSGNEIGLSLEEWQELPEAERTSRDRLAAERLTAAGAHFTASSVACCAQILEEIDRRIGDGERP
jgi:phosphonoacetaldehyde hydrolase